MKGTVETWGLVLAGGDGSRLREMTTTREGVVIPKQYCSLTGTSCLLQNAILRAQSIAMPSPVAAVVAAQHRRWWDPALQGLSESNVFVQPHNRGTAYGILFGLLRLERLNPNATVVLLPADHYFRDEKKLIRVLRAAVNLTRATPEDCYLLGAEPEGPDPELGYILPVNKARELPSDIIGFKEKPSTTYAREWLSLGALWNLFIFVGSIGALLALFNTEYADRVNQMREALRREWGGEHDALNAFYQSLKPLDFSRDLLEVQAGRLKTIRVPKCGWTDLGTRKRVEATLRGIAANRVKPKTASASQVGFFDLSARFEAI